MSTPGEPNYPGSNNPYNPGGQPGYPGGQPGQPVDPYAPGPPGYPGGQGGFPGQPGGYPGQPGGYQGPPGGYPAQQGGYQGPPGGSPGHPGGYPGQPGGYPTQQGGYQGIQPYPGPPAAGYQGYGQYPGGPGGAGLPPEPVRPNTVTYAFWCWILTTVAALVGLILTLTSSAWDDALAAGVRTSGGVTIDVQSLVTTVRVFAIVAFLIFAGVYLLFAFKMRAGRNWARIVLTVFGVLTVLSALAPTTSSVTVNSQTYTAASQGPNWVTAVLAVVGVVLMYLSASNRYFAESKTYKQIKAYQQLGR